MRHPTPSALLAFMVGSSNPGHPVFVYGRCGNRYLTSLGRPDDQLSMASCPFPEGGSDVRAPQRIIFCLARFT